MNKAILFLVSVTAFLLGAQTSSFIPFPLMWEVWAVIILVILFFVMIKINRGNK